MNSRLVIRQVFEMENTLVHNDTAGERGYLDEHMFVD